MLWERLRSEEADPSLAAAAAALTRDPRRLVAVVADAAPAAAARHLAATFPIALARDPLASAGDGLAEFSAALLAAGEGPAAIVLDGPDDTDALALLPALLARGLRPDLRVVVPCDRTRAGRLAFVAGGYPRSSIAVVATTQPTIPLPDKELDLELLPLVLVGRLPCNRLEREPFFVEREFAERHPASGDLVCLLSMNARAAVARRALDAAPDAASGAVRAVLAAAPTQRARLLCGLATAGFVPDDTLADELCAFEAAELPAPLEWIRRGTPLPAWALRAIDRRAEQLAADFSTRARSFGTRAGGFATRACGFATRARGFATRARGFATRARGFATRARGFATRARGFATRAWIAKLEDRPADDVLALLDSGLVVASEPAAAAQLALLRSEWSGSADGADQALAFARAADAGALRAALAHRAGLREACEEWEDALNDQLECEQSAVIDDELGTAAAAALAVARLCEALHRPGEAAAAAERAAAQHGATGDPARAAFAWMRAASLHVAARDGAAAHSAASAACALGECTGDARLVGYARWFLGALAERNADPAAAAREYALSVDAYATLGAVPDRLLPSLERARAAAAGRARQLAGDASTEVQIPDDAAYAQAFPPQADG